MLAASRAARERGIARQATARRLRRELSSRRNSNDGTKGQIPGRIPHEHIVMARLENPFLSRHVERRELGDLDRDRYLPRLPRIQLDPSEALQLPDRSWDPAIGSANVNLSSLSARQLPRVLYRQRNPNEVAV